MAIAFAMCVTDEHTIREGGVHLFSTAPQSFQSEEHAVAVFADLIGRFPATEGYEVTLTRCDPVSTRVAHRSSIQRPHRPQRLDRPIP